MYSIDKIYEKEIIIQKSRFICLLVPINNNDIKDIISNIKSKYKGATHYCYAYITKYTEKYNDDGEPSGTAGNPILTVLKRKHLVNVLAVVIRYFGGIKLGAGGLIRAYTNSVTECLSISNIIEVEDSISIEIICSYENINSIFKIVDEKYIKEKKYEDNINLLIHIPMKNYELIKNSLESLSISIIEKKESD